MRRSRGETVEHTASPDFPLVVNIHGSGRNTPDTRDGWIEFTEAEQVVILASLFPAELGQHRGARQYDAF